jgi:hypothetical protein
MPSHRAERGGQCSELPSSDVNATQILDILDKALVDPDVTVFRLRFLRHLLEADREVDSYSNWEIAQIIVCAERTARNVKQWGRQFVAAMYEEPSEVQEQDDNNMHMDATVALALQQLEQIEWGMLNGQKIKDGNTFIEEHGALNILYAIWCSRGKKVRNPAGFVTWWCREGHQAPNGWLPAELRQQGEQKTKVGPPEPPPGVPPERPETPEALIPLWEEVLTHVEPQVRPGGYRAWIEPLSLVTIEEEMLVLWAPDGFHAEWVDRHFGQPLQRVCHALGYRGYRQIWQPQSLR